MNADLSAKAFFELPCLPFDELFAGDRVWGALTRIDGWIAAQGPARIEGRVAAGAWIEGEVHVGKGSVVEPGAYVQGPCWIGRDVEVRHGAYVRGRAIVGDGAVVGHATEVKGSIFLPGAKAGHFAYVGDSILGRDVNLGAGTKLANLKLRGDEVILLSGRERVSTGLRKLGAILGDGVQTGCNSVTNPGTLLGPRCLVVPCASVSGVHAAGTVLRAK